MQDHQRINDMLYRDYWKLVTPLLLKFGFLTLLVLGEVLLRAKLALPVYIDYYGTPSHYADDVMNPEPLSVLITVCFSLIYLIVFPALSQGAKSNLFGGMNPNIRKGILFWFHPKYWVKAVLLRIRTTLIPTLLFFIMVLIPMYAAPYITQFIQIPGGLPGDLIRLAYWVLGLSASFCLFGFYLGLCSRWFLAPYLLSAFPDKPLSEIILKSADYSKGYRFYIMGTRLATLPILMLSGTILPAFYLLPYRNIRLGFLANRLIFCRKRP